MDAEQLLVLTEETKERLVCIIVQPFQTALLISFFPGKQ
jgi:hypothetical protein